jgi:hypothetical protein
MLGDALREWRAACSGRSRREQGFQLVKYTSEDSYSRGVARKTSAPRHEAAAANCYYLAQHGSATEFATVNGEKVARPAELFSTSWNRVSESQEASLARHSLSFLY